MEVIMKSNVVSFIQHLKIAQEHAEDFRRQNRSSKGDKLFEKYAGKINWIFKDIITMPFFTEVVREGMRREIASDVLAVPAIHEKIALLPPDYRIELEREIDRKLEELKY